MSAAPQIHVSIIVPTRNHSDMLIRLVRGLSATAAEFEDTLELIIVDNNSDEPTLLEFLDNLTNNPISENFTATQVLRYPHKFNYSAINNYAVSKASGRYVCFLNNDIEIINNAWLQALCKPMEMTHTGCVGAMLYYPDNTIQHAGVYLDVKNIADHIGKNEPRGTGDVNNYLYQEKTLNAVTAACLLVSRAVFDEVGGFEEALAVAFNDIDFCLKVKRAGYKNRWTPNAELIHHESKTRGLHGNRSLSQKLNHKKEVFLMKRRWGNELGNDPHHPDNTTVAPHLHHRSG